MGGQVQKENGQLDSILTGKVLHRVKTLGVETVPSYFGPVGRSIQGIHVRKEEQWMLGAGPWNCIPSLKSEPKLPVRSWKSEPGTIPHSRTGMHV
jgi:hypothetical protein